MSARTARARRVVGGLYLFCAGLNAGLVLADPEVYRDFAASSYLAFVQTGWTEIVMAAPTLWILLLAAGELVIGTLLLSGVRPTIRVGWICVAVFQVLLMLFGFGFWIWSIPALLLVVLLARRDLAWESASVGRAGSSRPPAQR